MNADLMRAERELAKGNADEARIHAWNALSTLEAEELPRLREVAEELDDQLLIREIERRGIPALDEPSDEKPLQLRSLIFPVVVGALVLSMVVNTLAGEAGPPKPSDPGDPTFVQQGPPLLTQTSGVWLVRIGPSERLPLRKLADEVTFKYGIPVGVLEPIEQLPSYVIEEDGKALRGDALFFLLRQWYVAEKRATIIGVTDYSMTSDVLDENQPFLLRNASNYGVISNAHLGAGLFDRIRGRTRYVRTRKLVGRAIGFIHLRRPVSPDRHSLLRSEMSGTGDIDALDERL